jgi:prepilin-type processing-associated H-X9-DG protein
LKKYFVLAFTLLFGNVAYADGHGSVYMIDFKCDQEAYEVFATMTLEELDGQFLKGSTKLARYHDLTSGSGIVLVESEDPSLVMEFANGWSELCESKITPVVNDKKAMAILTKK